MSEDPYAPKWWETYEQIANRHFPWWLRVCDKAGVPLEVVKDPQDVALTLRHGATSTGHLTLPARHVRVPQLMADGARYRIDSVLTDEVMSSGTIRGGQGQGSPDSTEGGQIGTATWTLVDDHAVLSDWHVAPPAGKAYYELRGPAELVARTLITAAAARLGIPLHMPASEGRGAEVVVSARWQPLADVLYPAITVAGIGLHVRWDHIEARYEVECYEPQTWPKEITTFSGVVNSWAWSQSYPGATRAVVLGPREGPDRLVRTVTDTALETALGAVREVTVDARDIGDVDPDPEEGPPRTLAMVEADMDARGQEHLDEHARTVGLQLALASVPELALGRPNGLRPGDVLQTQLIPGRPLVNVPVTSMSMTWDGAGFRITPEAGEWSGEGATGIIARRIRDLSVGWRRQKAST